MWCIDTTLELTFRTACERLSIASYWSSSVAVLKKLKCFFLNAVIGLALSLENGQANAWEQMWI